MTAESTVETALFLKTVPRLESMRRVVAGSPSAPERQVGMDVSVAPLLKVVTDFCQTYCPS